MTHTHTLMCSDGLQGDLRSSAAFGISQIVCVCEWLRFLCAHTQYGCMLCVCVCVGFQQTSQHQLSQFPRTSVSLRAVLVI